MKTAGVLAAELIAGGPGLMRFQATAAFSALRVVSGVRLPWREICPSGLNKITRTWGLALKASADATPLSVPALSSRFATTIPRGRGCPTVRGWRMKLIVGRVEVV